MTTYLDHLGRRVYVDHSNSDPRKTGAYSVWCDDPGGSFIWHGGIRYGTRDQVQAALDELAQTQGWKVTL